MRVREAVSAVVEQWPKRQAWQRSVNLVSLALLAIGNAALTFGVIFILIEFFNAFQHQQGWLLRPVRQTSLRPSSRRTA
jgi:hypothetical protein